MEVIACSPWLRGPHSFQGCNSAKKQQQQQARPPAHRHLARCRRERVAARSFMGSVDFPSLFPGWLVPWPLHSEDPDTDSHAGVRQQRLRKVRNLLAAACTVPPLPLPPAEDSQAAPAGGGGGGGEESGTLGHAASNAVPFVPGGQGAGGIAAAALAAGSCRAEEARQVLPWLYAVQGRLDFAGMEALASQLALSGLQLLDITRYATAGAGATAGSSHAHSLPAHIRWAGPAGAQGQPLPSPAVAAAAALRRMELRRGGALAPLPETEGKAVVLAYHPQHRQLAAEALALYLHAYLGLSGQEAVQAAGHAVGASPLRSALHQSLEELAMLADGWQRRVTLAWPYAGGHVEVVGDAVGGWDQRVPMYFDVRQKRWRLQIWGLQPGVHRFKYLCDGCWVIDLAAHTEADSRGNINNVCVVAPNDEEGWGSRMHEQHHHSHHKHQHSHQQQVGPAPANTSGTPILAAAEAAAQGSVLLATAAESMVSADGADAAEQQERQSLEQGEQQQQQPWRNDEEMERMARYGAALLAFHTRLGVQLRHVLH